MRALLVILAALVLAAPAGAANRILRVDDTAYPTVTVTVLGARDTAPALQENGRAVAGLEATNLGRCKSVVLAVDRSQSMRGQALRRAVAAARGFVSRKPDCDRIAVVAFGSDAVQLSRFSGSTIDADLALRNLDVDATQGTALYDAVVLGAAQLAGEAYPGRVLILVTDGTDVSSAAGVEAAVDAARQAGASVYGVGIESEQFAPDALRRVAEETGGTYRGAASSAQLGEAYAAIAYELRRTWRLRYVTAARPGERLEVTAGTAKATVTLAGRSATRTSGGDPVLPREAVESSWGAPLVGVAVGVLLLGSLVLLGSAKRGAWVRGRLTPYVGSMQAARARQRKSSGERFAAGSAVLRATERALGHLAWWRSVRRLLERADVPLSTAEFVYGVLGSAFVVGLLAAVAAQSSLVILAGFAVGGAVPFGYVKLKASRRLKAFENQLPDLLLTLAASLKAGHSFKQGIQTVVDEGQPPASKEFQRVLAETQLGRPMEDALQEMAERVNSKNLDFVVTAVIVQGQVGGSLAGLFDMVAEAVRQRQQFQRKIRGLTAMGRASAYVLVGLPFFTAGVITLLNKEFMDPLYNTSTGHKLILTGLVMMTVGSLMLRKIVSFKG